MKFDLIIIGGGMVGASLAKALQHANLNIALVEAALPRNDDPRLFALNYSSCEFFKNLKIWDAIYEHATPIHEVHVSKRGSFGKVYLKKESVNLDALGYLIPAEKIESALNTSLSSLSNLTLYQPAILKTITHENNINHLTISSNDQELTLESPLVIGADGANSVVRSQLKIEIEETELNQYALVTRTMLNRPHQHIAYERFIENGAIAMLPLYQNQCATIWSADETKIQLLMQLNDTDFIAELQKEFGYRLGRFQNITKRFSFPLNALRAKKMFEHGVLLLGNAAHTLHPIAAQGFNLALFEVAIIAEKLLMLTSQNQTITEQDLLASYEAMQSQQFMSIGTSHLLTQFLQKNIPFKNTVFALGMIGLEMISPIKTRFIKGMIGRGGRVPRLLLSGCEYDPIC